jgi:hypothetical protein
MEATDGFFLNSTLYCSEQMILFISRAIVQAG